MRTEGFKRGVISILLAFALVFSMISVAPLASPGDWVNDPAPGGTIIQVAQGENFLIRHTLEWDEGADGSYTVTISWVNYENKPYENFTFLGAEAYFDLDNDNLPDPGLDPILAVVTLDSVSLPDYPGSTVYGLSVSCPADQKDSRNGEFNVDITLSASGAGGVPHIPDNHEILEQLGGVIIIESGFFFGNRAPITISVGGRGVSVSISPSEDSGLPAQTLSYTVTVQNIGGLNDTYDLTVSDNAGWGPTLSEDLLEVPTGENRQTTLSVTVPANAPASTKDKITVTATSRGNTDVSDNASCIAHAAGVDVLISPSYQSSPPGEGLEYTVTVRNFGVPADTYTLENRDNAGWSLSLDNALLTVPAGEDRTTTLRVTIPDNAIGGTSDNITVTATLTENVEVTDNDSSIARAAIVRDVEVSIEPSYQENENGGTLAYTVTVANTGNVPDTYTLENSDTKGWTLSLENASLEVPESENRTTTLTVTIPENAADSTDDVTVTATSTENATVSSSNSCIAHAVVVKGLREVMLYPIDDARVSKISSWINFGTENLRVGYKERAFLKFKLEKIPVGATIESVELYLKTVHKEGGGENVQVHRVDTDDWDEDTITWANMPSVGELLDNRNCSENNQWYDWNVTSFGVSQWENENDRMASFSMVSTGEATLPENTLNHYIEFYAKESINGRRPFLKVIYRPSPNSFFVSISPSYQSGLRGETLNYTVMVKNVGWENSTYNLENRDDAGWAMTLDKVQFENVSPGENRTATLTVTIPDNAAPYTRDNVTVTATLMENEDIRGDASGVAHSTVPALEVTITPDYQSGVPGWPLTYEVMVKNVGVENDSYSLEVTDNEDWHPTLDNNLFENVPSGENRTTTLRVTIPDGTPLSTEDEITVTATSLVDTTVENSANSIAHSGFTAVGVSITPENQSGLPGTTLAYTVTITNTGNVEDTYDLSVSDNAGWDPTLSESLLEVPVGESRQTTMNVMVPANAPTGTMDNVTITVTSRADTTVENSASSIAHSGFLAVEVSIAPENQGGEADYNISGAFDIEYTVTVVNKGTIADTYILTVSSDNADWSLLLPDDTLEIPGGENKTTTFYVEIPTTSVPLSTSDITVTATSQTDNTVSGNASCVAHVTIVDFEIALSPSYQRALLGEDLFYTLTVTNTSTGAIPKTHYLSISDNANWIIPENVKIAVPAGESADSYLTIRVSDNASHGTMDNFTVEVKAISFHIGGEFVTKETSAIAHATALKNEVIILTPMPKLKRGKPGDNISFRVMVRNIGLESDTYDLTVVDDAIPSWNWRFDDNPLEDVQAENNRETKLWVTIPDSAPTGMRDNLMVIATSSKDPTISASDNCIVLVENFRMVDVSISPGSKSGAPGETLTYTVTVTNTGNIPDNYDLTASDDAGWGATLAQNLLTIPAGGSRTTTVSVTLPSDAAEGELTRITVIATSTEKPTVIDSATCIASAAVGGVEVSISPPDDSAEPGRTLTFTVTVKNTGSVPDNYVLTVSDDASWGATLDKSLLTIPAGGNRTTTVRVTVPSDAVENESTQITVVATSQAAPAVSDSATFSATAKELVTGIPLVLLATSVFLIGAVILVMFYLLRVRPRKAVRPTLFRERRLGLGAPIPGMGRKKAARRRVLRDVCSSAHE